MATDFGLFVGRHNTAKPSLVDDDLREVRLDGCGNLENRAIDGNDSTISYFADCDAVGSGVGDHSGSTGTAGDDRGVLILGLNAADSKYEVLSVDDQGCLCVSFEAGTDCSEAADKAAATDGEITNAATYKLIQEIAASTDKIHVDGWSYASDKNTIFQLVLSDDTGADGHDRADIVCILDSQISTSARPSEHVVFSRALTQDVSALTTPALVVWAKQLQAGTLGCALSMINAHKSS